MVGRATPAPTPAPGRRPNPLKDRVPIKAPPPIVRQSTPAKPPRQRVCPSKHCNSLNIEDGICTDCGTIIEEVNIVAEVSFGETSAGAAVVQGTYISADQGGAASTGVGGRGESNQREKTLREGKQLMYQMQAQLNISVNAVDAGHQIFKLAANANFIQGRRLDMVAIVSLYTACRKQRPCRVMLIDFADKIQVNVFKLGAAFKALHKAIPLAADGIMPILPEDLIHRFAQKLEFGDLCDKVAEDAVRMVKRMSLDWMVMGRRPSGVCGACLILAARMNNFRRTITEVVYIVKVTTHTIQKRLEEFKLTPSSALTVEEFLHNEFLESAHDPPSFYEKSEEFQKTKKRRKRKGHDALDNGDESGNESGSPNKRQKTTTPGPAEPRRDADGFAIPALPNQSSNNPAASNEPESNIDPSLRSTETASQTQPDTSSLPPTQSTGNATSNPPTDTQNLVQLSTPPQTQLEESTVPPTQPNEVQTDQPQSNITPPPSQTANNASAQSLSNDPSVDPELPEEVLEEQTETTFEKLVAQFGDVDDIYTDDAEPVNPRAGKKGPDNRPIQVNEAWSSIEQELEAEISEMINDPNTIDHAQRYALAKRRAAAHMIVAAKNNPPKEVSMDVHIGEDEFKDDPEVANCLLSAEDVAMKEKLWVNENKHWLRKQQIREWERRQAETGPPKAKRNRLKKPRMGENQTTAASTPGEAAANAVKRHAYSRKINYDAIKGMFDKVGFGNSLGSAATSRVTSQAGSDMGSEAGSRASSVAPSAAGDEGSTSDSPAKSMDIFPEPNYQRKRPRKASKAAVRASPAPLLPLAPRPSADPESVRSTPAPSEDGDDTNAFDYVQPEERPAAPVQEEEEVEDWRAALKKTRASGGEEQEGEFDDEGDYDDIGDVEPGGLGDFDDEVEGGFDEDVDEDMDDY
ncbi:hypothetical protein EG329_000965 [Mollisiaceae sp. DMI_Dod_QoI]|nr:hypothetical protein EG329_000965 [Helotiales sp. DMI_Dod_QoI]